MMKVKTIVWTLGTGLALSSCIDIGPEPDLCQGGDCDYSFYRDATVRVWEADAGDGSGEQELMGTQVVGGFNKVFEVAYVYNDAPNVADDELAEFVRFEVSQDVDGDFVLETAEELENANAYFSRSCYCIGPLVFPLTGRIEGVKNSNQSYDVTVDLAYENNNGQVQQIQFSRTFRQQQLEE